MLSSFSMRDRDSALTRAIKEAGGVGLLAKRLGIKPQAVSQWDEVPPLRVLDVERASGVTRQELRPDLYPVEATA
jgi:DNA-binding transcriptional regulator YdaS (Cro superfamily)